MRREVLRITELAGITPASRGDAVLRLTEERSSGIAVRASFHPAYAAYFATGTVLINLPEQAEDLLELVLAAGSTARGDIVGVVGTSGGVGASSIACWMARLESDPVALIDLDPASAGIDYYLGMETQDGIRWADIGADSGVLIPGRLSQALPHRKGLHLLSADKRGGVPPDGKAAERAIDALSQATGRTILDLPTAATVPGTAENGWLAWCDAVVLVCGMFYHHSRAAAAALARLPSDIPTVVIGRVKGAGAAAALAEDLGVEHVYPVRWLRGLDQDLEHGVTVGERARSATGKDIVALNKAVADALP